jgi:hypothetical protein
MVNLDALHTVLLSLHPKDCLGEYKLSDKTREGLAELHEFNNLILHEDDSIFSYRRRFYILIPKTIL